MNAFAVRLSDGQYVLKNGKFGIGQGYAMHRLEGVRLYNTMKEAELVACQIGGARAVEVYRTEKGMILTPQEIRDAYAGLNASAKFCKKIV